MLVSVTPLGASRAKGVAGAVAATVQYLDGRQAQQRDKVRSLEPGAVDVPESAGPVAYYADSSDTPGVWMGRGIDGIQLRGTVDREQLTRMLLGQDPRTGRQLVPRVRREASPAMPPSSGSDELLSLADAARRAHVGTGYLRRMARIGEAAMVRRTVEVMAGAPLTTPPKRWLAAERTGSRNGWRVSVGELDRFMGGRTTRPVVIAYDVTFSTPKSVSILWAVGDVHVRAEILRSIDTAVAAGFGYLEQHAAFVRVKGLRVPVDGVLAASYLHTTSRRERVARSSFWTAPGGPTASMQTAMVAPTCTTRWTPSGEPPTTSAPTAPATPTPCAAQSGPTTTPTGTSTKSYA